MGAIQTWGLFNADGTSDDYCNSDYIMIWLGNPSYTRIPDMHYMLESRYKGAQVVLIAPDYNASAMHADLWVNLRVATDAAFALGIAKVMVDEGLCKLDYVREQTDLPLLVRDDDGRFLRQSDLQEGGSDAIFYFWDPKLKKLAEAPGSQGHPVASIELEGVAPALEGEYTATLADGRSVTVRAVDAPDETPEDCARRAGDHQRPCGHRAARPRLRQCERTSIFASWGSANLPWISSGAP
jgi:anaerobic selenocysteine-containing dehydrogenase